MQKEEKLNITKEKLLDATFALMEEADDPLNVTSRQIAERAGTKPSMINYCFGSREDLLYEVFQTMYSGLTEDPRVRAALTGNLPPKEVLKEVHFVVAEYLIDHFTFTQAVTNYIIFKRNLGKESFSFPYVKAHYNGTKTDAECHLIAYELSTMMQLIIFRKDDIKSDFGLDPNDKKQLRKLIDLRVDLLLGE